MTEDEIKEEISKLLLELRERLIEILEPSQPSQTGFKITILDGFIGFEGFSYVDSMIVNEIKKFVEGI